MDPPTPTVPRSTTPPPPPTSPYHIPNPTTEDQPSNPASLPSPSLLSLPLELLLWIADYLPLGALFHLQLCCRHLHNVFLHRLVAAFSQHADHILAWSIQRISPSHFTRALDAGASISCWEQVYIITPDDRTIIDALLAINRSQDVNGGGSAAALRRAEPELLDVYCSTALVSLCGAGDSR